MSSEHETRMFSFEDAEISLKYIKTNLQDTINYLNTLTTVYYNLSISANQLNTNAFAHRGEVDDAVDRTVDVGHLLDKLIKQTHILLGEYQAALIVDQINFAKQVSNDEF